MCFSGFTLCDSYGKQRATLQYRIAASIRQRADSWRGEPFQPVIVQATDSSSPANPVEGAVVTFWQMFFRSDNVACSEGGAEAGSDYPMPVILCSSPISVCF